MVFMVCMILWGNCSHLWLFLLSYILFLFGFKIVYFNMIRVIFCQMELPVCWFYDNRFFLIISLLILLLVFFMTSVRFLPLSIDSGSFLILLLVFLLVFFLLLVLLILKLLLFLVSIVQNLVNLGRVKHKLRNHFVIRYIFSKEIIIQRVNILKDSFFLV